MAGYENRCKSFYVGSQTSVQAWEISDSWDSEENGDFPIPS